MLTRDSLKNIKQQPGIQVPAETIFNLPEKVLQFGTGVLLRGLPDYFIDKANRAGIFNGRVVVVKSTDSGDPGVFDKQDCLYTICVRGIENGENIEEYIINASISRVLSARIEWGKILDCARNPEMQLIISNTTEVGISFVKDDISQSPPVSFPGKLLAFLYERFKAFGGSDESGMVIVPTELIPENGRKLESIVLELAHLNGLEASFMDWLENSNHFCDSLVDRIVPGAPSATDKARLEEQLQYSDDLLIMAEVYRLWAIETASEKVIRVLSFSQVDKGVAIAPDITRFRELKLRLLNGTHTLTCALAILAGFTTVKESMEDRDITGFMQAVMNNDLIPAIAGESISIEDAAIFAGQVLDRFRNPFIEHKWLSISVQYSSKMKMRNLPVLLKFYEKNHSIPANLALGFAAFLLFMRVEQEGGAFTGEINGRKYTVQDDRAEYFSRAWKETPVENLVVKILQDESLWGTDLTELNGFADVVNAQLQVLMRDGPHPAIRNMISEKTVLQS